MALHLRRVAPLLTLLLLACAGEDGATPAPEAGAGSATSAAPAVRVVLATPDTLISTASGIIAGVVDMAVADDGTLYVLDYGNNAIHVLNAEGRFSRSFGREGAGPGEFSRAWGLRFYGDTLAVIDMGNGRLQLLDTQGGYLASKPLPPGSMPPALGPNYLIVTPTLGVDTVLAWIHGSDLEERGSIGRIVGSPSRSFRVREFKEMSQRGEVPEFYLNMAQPEVESDGSIWLTVAASASVELYDSLGTRAWSIVLEDPEFPAIREAWVSKNATGEMPWPLEYFLDAQIVGEDLWILLGQSASGEAAIRVVTRSGAPGPLWTFPNVSEAGAFLVDEAREQIFFSRPNSADLLRVSLQ